MNEQGALAGLERGGAEISADGLYRYRLWRHVGAGGATVAFVMLNPSTADSDHDDPTLRRCLGYARAWGFDHLEVVNLYAYRATRPRDLLDADDPVGPMNPEALDFVLRRARIAVCGWGSHARPIARRHPRVFDDPRLTVVTAAARCRTPLHALRVTGNGDPSHPLYLPADLDPQPWP